MPSSRTLFEVQKTWTYCQKPPKRQVPGSVAQRSHDRALSDDHDESNASASPDPFDIKYKRMLVVVGTLEGIGVKICLDTGADINFVPQSFFDDNCIDTVTSVHSACLGNTSKHRLQETSKPLRLEIGKYKKYKKKVSALQYYH